MNYKKLIALFILLFFVWIMIFLYRDLRAAYVAVGIKSILLSLLSTAIIAAIWPPFRRWYRKNYDKNYKYSNSKDLPRKKNE